MSITETTTPPTGKSRRRWTEIVVGVVGIIAYVNTPWNGFCDDGVPIVAQNAKVTQRGQWRTIWTTDYWSDAGDATPNRDLLYRPVALSSYRIVNALFGIRPVPHHILNMILHAAICIMVVRFSRCLGGSMVSSATAGVLFAVLPIHTAVLNNVVGRADLLASVFILLTLFCHRRALIESTRPTSVGWYILSAAAAFCAMASKENGIAVLALVPLFDAFLVYQRSAKGKKAWFTAATAGRVAYLLIPALLYGALRYSALDGSFHQAPALTKTVNVLVDAPAWQRAFGCIQLWGMYWYKTFWPRILCVNYSINAIRLATSLLDFYVILGIFVTSGLAGWSYAAWRRGDRRIAFASIAIVIAFFPTSNTLTLIQVFFAERIWYLPSIWVAILAGLMLERFLARGVTRAALALVIVAMIGRCWMRNAEWRDNGTLYAAAYRDHPDGVGTRHLLGHWLARTSKDGQGLRRAIELLNASLEIDPGFTDSQRSLGYAYLRYGDYQRAVRHLQIADMHVPHDPPTVDLLGIASRKLMEGQSQVLETLRARADSQPDDLNRELDYVRKLCEVGRVDRALERIKRREADFSGVARWQAEMAVIYVYLNDRDEAINRYEKCLELNPQDPQRRLELAMLLLERRTGDDIERAWSQVRRAEALAPGDPLVLAARAELTALGGDIGAAIKLYEQAVESMPNDSELRRKLQNRAKALGSDKTLGLDKAFGSD